jgi:hypothetical protein
MTEVNKRRTPEEVEALIDAEDLKEVKQTAREADYLADEAGHFLNQLSDLVAEVSDYYSDEEVLDEVKMAVQAVESVCLAISRWRRSLPSDEVELAKSTPASP